MTWAPLRHNSRWLVLVISALSYGLGALTITWVMAILFNQGAGDRAAGRFWAFVFASQVWLLGASFASITISPAKQLRWWPLSILLAAFHGGTVVLAVAFLVSGGRSDIESATIFALIGAVAAAISYTYFLIMLWIIGKKASPPAQRLSS